MEKPIADLLHMYTYVILQQDGSAWYEYSPLFDRLIQGLAIAVPNEKTR